MSTSTVQIAKDGLWYNNAALVQLLGMCPLLATSTSVSNALGMGAASTAVLVAANVVVSMIRKVIPDAVRIPAFIVIIAGMVTVIDLGMNAFAHPLHKELGIFIPLIVVNCIILGRAEAYASKHTVWESALDGLFSGLGFTLAIAVLGSIREILGAGTLFGFPLLGESFHPVVTMVLPPGAFIVLAFILMVVNWLNRGKDRTP